MEIEQLTARLREARPRLDENLVVLARTDSTNDFARRVIESAPAGSSLPAALFVALEQTSGRGRDGRAWLSRAGAGLYASLLWPLEGRETVASVPLAVAVGLCGALRSAGASDCRVKWPNDLVVEGRKVGGILIEVVGPATGRVSAVIGFGVNLAMDRDRLDALGATSLQLVVGDKPDLGELVLAASRGVRAELEGLSDRSSLVRRYRELIAHRRGDRLIWRQGMEVVEGSYWGIDEMGCLELETESGMRVVNAGEIVIG